METDKKDVRIVCYKASESLVAGCQWKQSSPEHLVHQNHQL